MTSGVRTPVDVALYSEYLGRYGQAGDGAGGEIAPGPPPCRCPTSVRPQGGSAISIMMCTVGSAAGGGDVRRTGTKVLDHLAIREPTARYNRRSTTVDSEAWADTFTRTG